MAPVALFKRAGVQIAALVSDRALRRTWTGHVCFARSSPIMPTKAALCQQRACLLLLP